MNRARTARDRLDRMVTITGRAFRFWPAASLVVLVGTVAAILFTFTRPRLYKSETLILYSEGLRSGDAGALEPGDPARKLALRLKEMALSRSRLQQIIDEYKLYPDIMAERGTVDAVDEMRSHIAFRVKDGDTFGLSFEGDDPARVQSITARLGVALIDENSKNRAEQAEATREMLDAERKHADDELRDKEAALNRFLTKHPEFVKEAQRPQTHTKPGNDPTLLALEREAARLQERLGAPAPKRAPAPVTRVPTGDGTPDSRLAAARSAAEAELQQAQRDLAEKLSQFTDQHPDVKAARASVMAAEAKVQRAKDALAAAGSSADVAAQQKAAADEADEGIIDRSTLESQLGKVNQEIADYKNRQRRRQDAVEEKQQQSGATWIVALENEWSQLSRDVQEARAHVGHLNEKQFKMTVLAGNSASRNATLEIIDPAYRPTHPSKPSRSLLLVVGLLLSIGLGMAMALMLALMDDRLYDRIDVEQLELLPLLAVVPRAAREKL
jgi:uncharacterized protein involved in exopolysaccharide biosynthesis